MGKFKKLLLFVIVVALVSAINWAYFVELLSLTKEAAIECLSGGSSAGDALTAELQSLSLNQLFEFSMDEFITDIWNDKDGGENSAEDVADNDTTEEATGEESTEVGNEIKLPEKVSYDSKQIGCKWGKHKTDYPNMKDYTDYQNYADTVFYEPDQIVYDAVNKEYLYIKGIDLLRISEIGEFISLYPGAGSQRVINAISNGGTIWPQY